MSGPKDAIALAERVLALLAEGSFSATYKYALFIALLDLCLEQTSKRGAPPSTLTTRQREWARMVAAMNELPETRLEEFLFGASRISLEGVRSPLREFQSDRCFYCDERLGERSEVDHFIPWSRHPDNGLDNLVVAHGRCNNDKRDFLAATEHVERWAERTRSAARALDELSQRHGWTRDAQKTFGVARAMYGRLPDDARLWLRKKEFQEARKELIVEALAA